jgi:hypothetical protein
MAKRSSEQPTPAGAEGLLPATDLRELARRLGVPCNQKGQPDLYDHVPNQRVSVERAKEWGMSLCWPGGGCRYGHDSAVWVSNPRRCVSCDRLKKGLLDIYPTIKVGNHQKKPRAPGKDSGAPLVIAAPKEPELDGPGKRFIDKYAELRNIHAAAKAVSTTPELITARRAHDKALDSAMARLENDLSIPALVPVAGEFEWSDEKRDRLVEAYVDSGNLSIGRAAIGVTPSQLWRELDRNPTFSSQLDKARVRAAQVFEERAHAEALNGNDKLLPVVLKAERPDKYNERLRVDVSQLPTDPKEITRQILELMLEFRQMGVLTARANVIEGEVVELAQLPAPDSSGDLL